MKNRFSTLLVAFVVTVISCHEAFSFFVKRTTLSIFAVLLLVVYAKYFIQRT